MISFESRGHLAGYEQAKSFARFGSLIGVFAKSSRPLYLFALGSLASHRWDEMRRGGFAHIGTRQEFTRGFVPGFETFFLQGDSYGNHVR